MSDPGERPARRQDTAGAAERRRPGPPLVAPHRVWVVLSAILDPLYYYLAGPHIPPGTMTDVAQGASSTSTSSS